MGKGEATWDEGSHILSNGLKSLNVDYYVFQGEDGTTTGYEHFQGVVQFTTPRLFSTLRRLFSDSERGGLLVPHWEKCRNPERAIEYCKKHDTRVYAPVEHGWYPDYSPFYIGWFERFYGAGSADPNEGF